MRSRDSSRSRTQRCSGSSWAQSRLDRAPSSWSVNAFLRPGLTWLTTKAPRAPASEPDEDRRRVLGMDVDGIGRPGTGPERDAGPAGPMPDGDERGEVGQHRLDPKARDELRRVEPVRPDVRDRPRLPRDERVDAPVVVGRLGQPVLDVRPAHEADLAELTAGDERPGSSDHRVAAVGVGDRAVPSVTPRERRDRGRGRADRDRPASRRRRACRPR